MLSILIPTYNYNVTALVSALYKQCMESGILFEIIVADDASGSATGIDNPQITQFAHCRFIKNPANLGRTLTRKKLAEMAQFETLLFLDADVLPATNNFINNYAPYIGTNQVVVGGYAYRPADATPAAILRYKYGVHREQKTAEERNKNPYGSIFSGNFLISRDTFLKNNYSQHNNLYGMDNYFSYNLYINKVKILHIDNNIYHLGLEDNAVFFKKCIESVKNRKELLANAPGIEQVNSLLKHYKNLKKYRLTGVVAIGFYLFAPLLKKMILKKDPNLFCLDIYRLGYICSLK